MASTLQGNAADVEGCAHYFVGQLHRRSQLATWYGVVRSYSTARIAVGHVKAPIADVTREYMPRLAEAFEIVWCSDWQWATRELNAVLKLPELPYIDQLKVEGPYEWWKLAAVRQFLGEHEPNRDFAWVDDHMTRDAENWADALSQPALLIAPPPFEGMSEKHYAALLRFALGSPPA